jgi:diacylglycerol kinase family enzyme
MADGGVLTTGVRLRKVEAVINPLAGSTGPEALAEMQDLLADFGVGSRVQAVQPRDLSRELQAALDRGPDLLIVLAGDGTARAACELAGERGPLVAPLPGGTMNVLPKALYGTRDWKTALSETLETGVVREVSGGEVDGKKFFCGAMLGGPALWARAREAVRERSLTKAYFRARKAWRRTFGGYVRFCLDDGVVQKAEALTLLSPLKSRRMHEELALEVAALNPSGLKDAARVGFKVLIGDAFGEDWRDDPAVDMGECTRGRAWSRGDLPAFLDGEPTRLSSSHVTIRFVPKAFRALVPPQEAKAAD